MKPEVAAAAPAALRPRDGGRWRERSGRLFAEFQRPARAMIRRAFRGAFSDEEVDDIYAGAWVGILRALGPRHDELSDDEVRSYVLTAVAHQAGKELRRRRRKPTAPLELVGAVPDLADGPEERLSGAEQSRVTRDLLSTLPPRRRAVMLLRYGWGLEPRQVCDLLRGLSPRAYRKEITRGVDELTEKMRAFERGEWCADREPVLKAYAAGIADDDQRRQARAHLSHCRDCASFVKRLSGHLHELGSGIALPIAVDGFERPAALGERLVELGDRARESAATLVSRSRGLEETAVQTAAAGGAKGAGAAGVGVLAKLAGLGVGGKFALACVTGGVAATACVAAGVAPFIGGSSPGDDAKPRAGRIAPDARKGENVVAIPSPTAPPTVGASDADANQGAATSEAQPRRPPAPTPPDEPSDPVSPEAPPIEQEFGVAPAAATTPTDTSALSQTSSSDGNGSAAAVRQEFGP